jgi:hypothetical protein
MLLLVPLPSLPSFILSMPSLLPSPTFSDGDFPPIFLSRRLSHPVTTTTRSGSRIGLSLAFSILPKALPSVLCCTISRGTFRSRHCSSFGCNFLHSASVLIIIPYFYAHRSPQGAQMTYYSVLRPVFTNLSHRGCSTRTTSNDTVTAEGLRDRVATATSE